MDKTSRWWIIASIALVIVGSAVLSWNRQANRGQSPALQVTATFYLLAEFARAVGGNHVQVTTLVQPGMEPHDYEPSARDTAGMYRADLLIYNGGGLEPWLTKMQKELQADNVMLADASTGIKLRTEPAEHGGTTPDPHYWLDPQLAVTMVNNIKTGLIAVDPEHAYDYVGRAQDYIQKLNELDKSFTAGLAACQTKNVITAHQSLNYLAARYGLTATGIAGLSPEDEPSPQKLAEVADFTRTNHIGYILFESAVSPKLSQTIAREAGAQILSFNPLESLTAEELKAGKSYLSVQQDNLKTLQTALQCTP